MTRLYLWAFAAWLFMTIVLFRLSVAIVGAFH